MTVEELQQWLEEHIDHIATFMDYEPTIDSEPDLAVTLGYWFGSDYWSAGGDRLVHLGIDGMGSQFAAWIRPGAEGPPPIVYLGSEGGRGVLAKPPKDWALCLAHAPGIDEYPGDDEPARLDREMNWMLNDDEDPDAAREAREALESYRAAARDRFGALAPLDDLTADIGALNEEFLAWVEAKIALRT